MKMRQLITLCAATAAMALQSAGAAFAIEHATTPATDETRNTLIASGTLVRIVMLQTVTSAHCKAGDKFLFRVVANVMAGDRVAIPTGANGTGKISDCRPAHGGRVDGRLRVEFDPLVLADGTQVLVAITHDSVVADQNEKNGTAPALEDIANMTIPGFFILDFLRKGDDVTLGANAPFHVAVVEDAFLSQ